ESLLHGMLHQTFCSSHFIVGPDDASPQENDHTGRFYGEYEAQEYLDRHRDDLAIKPVFVERHRYDPAREVFVPVSKVGEAGLDMAEPELRRRMMLGDDIPGWVSFPEVLDKLSKVYPKRNRQGFTLFFTGLSGSGKSTLSRIIYAKLVEDGRRPVTLLDGDIVRQNLSSELGFSREHRNLNIRRIGFVANEITRNGGVAICAPIAPYRETRRSV